MRAVFKWAIGIGMVAAMGFGIVRFDTYLLKHDEAPSECYDVAKDVAGDKDVQLAMSDGFLSKYECDHDVMPAVDRAKRAVVIRDFMNAAHEADNAASQ